MFDRLRQRNVHRVALAYLASAWVLIQVVDTLTPDVLPAGAVRATVVVVAIGLVPALVLAWLFEWTPEGLRRERDVPAVTQDPNSRWFDRAIIVTLVVAVAYFAIDKFVIDPVRDNEQIKVATTQAVEEALAGQLLRRYANRSIIVLPFLNISPDRDQEYFADGISEELLNLLSKIEELRVISRSTSWAYKGKDVDLAEVREKLDVSHILEGSVRKAGNQIRITAQLVDARTNRHLWSETYDRTLDDIFVIQDEISAMVVNQLKLELLAGPPIAEEIDGVAYDLYLQGRHLTHAVRTTESFSEAVNLLSRAVELAPDYVPAIWELARATSHDANWWNAPVEASAADARIRELVDRLVKLAPDSSYANGWLAAFAEREGDLQVAALYKERAVAGGNDANLYLQQSLAASFLAELGRLDEAEALARYVVNRDPACVPCVFVLADALGQAGKYREAAREVENLQEWLSTAVDPESHWYLGTLWLVAGEPGKAIEYIERASPGNRMLGRLLALHDLGNDEEFDAEFEEYVGDGSGDDNSIEIAIIYAWTGKNDLAFEYVERAIDLHGPEWFKETVARGADLYGSITYDPRWEALIDRYVTAVEDLSHIRFNPKLPAEVMDALGRQ